MFRYLRVAVMLFFVFFFPVIPIWAQEPAPAKDARQQDTTEYAKTYGVDLDEALRRLAFQDEIGNLNYQLTTNEEEEAFAGLWIQHTPSL